MYKICEANDVMRRKKKWRFYERLRNFYRLVLRSSHFLGKGMGNRNALA